MLVCSIAYWCCTYLCFFSSFKNILNVLICSEGSTHPFHHSAKACQCVLLSNVYCCSEIIRAIDSLQLTARQKVATPVDWKASRYLMRHLFSTY